MRTLFAVAVLTLGLISFPAVADPNNDAEACKPDVFRLCSSAIPWRDRIVTCLAENKRKLSPACQQVFNRRPSIRHARPARAETTGWRKADAY